jgi:large exoprotein involved in heme utilization and adhesion
MSTGIHSNAKETGDAGDISLEASAIEVLGGAQVSTSTRGSGNGGFLEIKGGRILLRSTSADISSGFYSRTQGGGQGGDIRVTGESLKILEGAVIDSSAFDAGDGGSIKIDADSVLVARLSDTGLRPGVLANTVGTGDESGDAGDIRIQAKDLEIRDRGLVDTRTLGPGSGGDMVIEVIGFDLATGGEITSSSEGSGDAGVMEVRAAQSVTVDGSGSEEATGLFSTASGAGDAGSVTVEVPALLLTEDGEISTATSGAGSGGDIQLRVDTLRLVDKGAVSSESSGAGDGGTIRIRAEESFLSDTGVVNTEAYVGRGGNITITAEEVQLSDGTRITAESFGPGDAGSIRIGSLDPGSGCPVLARLLLKDSRVTTEALAADGGNIQLMARDLISLDRSQVTASVGGGPQTTGGNISIDPRFVVLKKSSIVANAYQGRGGNIRIQAGTFLADPDSTVDASSALGIDGSVDIQAPVTNISGLIQPLSEDFKAAITMLREPCMARLHQGEYSSFLVSGRGGMPLQPGQALPSFLGSGL